MIDNQEIGVVDAPASLKVEALLVLGAILTQAIVAVAFDQVPYPGQRLKAQVTAAAALGFCRPFADAQELLRLLLLAQQRTNALPCHSQPAEAPIVGSALHQHGLKVLWHHLLAERDGRRN